jgi:hypothetical protein
MNGKQLFHVANPSDLNGLNKILTESINFNKGR